MSECCDCDNGFIDCHNEAIESFPWPCPCSCHKEKIMPEFNLEEIKRKARDSKQTGGWNISIPESDFQKLIEEVKRLHDVHDHYLFELDRSNKLKKENGKLQEINKNLMKNIGRNN